MNSYADIMTVFSYSHALRMILEASKFFHLPPGALVACIGDHATCRGMYMISYNRKIESSYKASTHDVAMFLEGCRRKHRRSTHRRSPSVAKDVSIESEDSASDEVRLLRHKLQIAEHARDVAFAARDSAETSRGTVEDNLVTMREHYSHACVKLKEAYAANRAEVDLRRIAEMSTNNVSGSGV